jgi:hypothetical protein
VTAETIANGADGKVLWFGRIRKINTNAYNEGDILYASTSSAGAFQTTLPVAPNNIVQVAAVVTKSTNNGVIFVRPTFGANINKDEGVKIVNPFTGHSLIYNSVNKLFENRFQKHSELVLDDGTNPHGTSKLDLGLNNVDNTSDLNKPISTATQASLDQKANLSALSAVAFSGDYEDLINKPNLTFDLDFMWNFTGTKTYAFPSNFEIVRINWVSLFGIILPKDNISYTVNPIEKTLSLGDLWTPSNGDKIQISAKLINA